MNIEKIKQVNTKIIGKEVIYYDSLESTQKEAKRLIKENSITNGTVIISSNQTKGIGTKERVWYTNKNENITMTIVIYPNCKIDKLEGLTTKIAKVIKCTIQNLYEIDLKIKEPNDLILNKKKICGILTEASTYEEKVKYILIGIGFNVNQVKFNDEIENIATSLKKETSKEYIIEDIVKGIIENLEKEIEEIV